MDLLIQFKKYLLQDKAKHSKATVKNYLADVRKFINWFENAFHAEFVPELITKPLVEVYIKNISSMNSQNQISAARSVKRYLSSLKKFYSFLLEMQFVTQNPFEAKFNSTNTEIDLFHLKEFKNYLLLSRASRITRNNYLADVHQFAEWLKKLPDGKSLNKISSMLVEEYKNRLLYEAKFSPVSVNRKLSSLRKYLSWLKTQGFINIDPVFEQVSLPSNNIETIQNSSIEFEKPKPELKDEFIYSTFPPML